ncbi:MAG: hypothetical protein WD749_04755 [Phycisphaerales bacterium]
MASKRQIVLSRPRGRGSEEIEPLGSAAEVIAALAPFNTAPDGAAGGALGTMTLHGPGMMVLMATTQPKVLQLMASLTDEEIALPVLMRACRALGWSMTDMESGRTFG